MFRRVAIVAAAGILTLAAAGAGTTADAQQQPQRIAYVGNSALYLSNADGSGRRLLVRGVADATTFSFSPDGQRIAFSGGRPRPEEIFLVNVDGGGLTQVTRFTETRKRTIVDWAANPSWSPDGTLIVFDRARDETDGDAHLFLIRPDGSGERQLTRERFLASFPAWSPDGQKILYEVNAGRMTNLYTIRPDGGGQRRLIGLRPEREHCLCAVWSPDGTKIAFEARGIKGRSDVYVMNADGSGRRGLTRHPSRDENPDWSPDGTQIAFYSERPGEAEVYVMNADGSKQRRITRDPWYTQAVRWQPRQG